jgi:hypothetical protein
MTRRTTSTGFPAVGFPGEDVITGVPKTPAELEAEKKKQSEQKSQKGNAIGGFLGMLPTIAGAIPGLMKSKQTGALEAMQQGRGAGAMAARQAGSEAGRRTAGNVGGRGSSGQVRAGLRSAEEMTSRGAQAAGIIGAREGMFATDRLMQDEQRRRQLGLQLGAGVGGATAAGLATALAGADQGPAGEEVAGALTGPSDETGLGAAGAGMLGSRGPEASMGGVFGTSGGRAFGEAPSLQPGPPGSPEGFGALSSPDISGAQAPAVPGAPSTELGQPELAPQGSEGFALEAMLTPEARFDAAQLEYTRLVTRPEDRPHGKSTGGSDEKAKQEQMQRDRLHLQQYLADEADKFEKTGGAYGINPEIAEQKLLFFDQSQGQISQADKAAMGGF